MCPFCGKMYWCAKLRHQQRLCPQTLRGARQHKICYSQRDCCIIITPLCCWLRSGVWANNDPWCCHSGAGWKYHLEPSALMHSRGLPPLCALTLVHLLCARSHLALVYMKSLQASGKKTWATATWYCCEGLGRKLLKMYTTLIADW